MNPSIDPSSEPSSDVAPSKDQRSMPTPVEIKASSSTQPPAEESTSVPNQTVDEDISASTPLLKAEGGHVVIEVDEIQPVFIPQYGSVEDSKDKGDKGDKEKEKKKKAKKEKAEAKSVSDALKIDMAAERTFFKWLWTGLHAGAIGSFIFVTFDVGKHAESRLVVVGFSWIVALLLVIYGTVAYYQRRRALRMGNIEEVSGFMREHSPLVVLLALTAVVGLALGYAIWTNRDFQGDNAAGLGGGLVLTGG